MLKRRGYSTWKRLVTVYEKKDSPNVRYYTNIVNRIILNVDNTGKNTFLVTSPLDSEGKSTTAINIGAILAQSGKKTLLIDADLMRPILGEFFELDNPPGLTDILLKKAAGKDLIIQDQHLLDLHVLPCGTPGDADPAMFISSNFKTFLKTIKASYDFIIIDSSSVNRNLSPLMLGSIVDGVVLVVLCDKTKKEQVILARDKITQTRGSITGVILNRIPGYIPSFYRS